MNHRRHCLVIFTVVCSVALLVFLGILGVIVYVDPLQVLHNQKSDPVYYYAQQRYSAAGLLRRHFLDDQDKETLLIGTSMQENTLISDVERLTYMDKALNLSFGACIYAELRAVYRMALRSPSLKNIVVEFMPKAYLGGSPEVWPDTPFPFGLYAANPLTRLRSMYLADTFKMSLDILRGKPGSPITNIETASNWMPVSAGQGLFSSFAANYKEIMRTQEPFNRVATPPGLEPFVDNLRATPEHIQVHVVVSPFFVGYTLPMDLYEMGLRTLVDVQRHKPNVRVYAFDDVAAITCNAANYKDLNHFGPGVNRYILRSIEAGKHSLNADNLDAYLSRVRQLKETMPVYADTANTVSFEGPLNEALFADPYAVGTQPLLP